VLEIESNRRKPIEKEINFFKLIKSCEKLCTFNVFEHRDHHNFYDLKIENLNAHSLNGFYLNVFQILFTRRNVQVEKLKRFLRKRKTKKGVMTSSLRLSFNRS